MTWGLIDSMTREQAEQIRIWRTSDQLMTWRGVAAAATATWADRQDTNQLLGRELCRKAAAILGEEPEAEPWN